MNCRKNHGKIYEINEFAYPEPPLHPNCRCEIERLRVLLAGTATNDEIEGADLHLKLYGKLADDECMTEVYVNKEAFFYWALQYGPHIEVVEPSDMRGRIAEAVKNMCDKYNLSF